MLLLVSLAYIVGAIIISMEEGEQNDSIIMALVEQAHASYCFFTSFIFILTFDF